MSTNYSLRFQLQIHHSFNNFHQQTHGVHRSNPWLQRVGTIREQWIDKYNKNDNFKRETESLLIAAQNNAIRTNYV